MPENKSVQSGQGNQGNQGGDGGRVETTKKQDGSRQAEQAPNQTDKGKGKNPGSRND
jgi:hypothetical protein